MLARDLPCVLMAVDPGKASGWALTYVAPYEPHLRTWSHGTTETWLHRSDACTHAHAIAHAIGQPLVVVAETWRMKKTGPKKSQSKIGLPQILSLAAQWGRWLAELERLDVPAKRIVLVETGTWRQAIFGRSRGGSAGFKTQAMMRARAVLGHNMTADEAEALCIGLYGLRSEKVAAAIGKRELRRLGWSEEGL